MRNDNFTVFAGNGILASGKLENVLQVVREYLDEGGLDRLTFFNDDKGYTTDFDLRGSLEDILRRLVDHPLYEVQTRDKLEEKRGRGRPKLGVVSKEVTLLPRHWKWLSKQRGGASVTLRKLVEDARKKGENKELVGHTRDSIHRFLWEMTSNFEHFEEVSRALFGGEYSRVIILIDTWPDDIKAYLTKKLLKLVELEKLS